MWSGDIGANMPSLEAQMNVQMEMSLSGIDYFGSDVGGFYRQIFDLGMDDLYTVWLANSVLLDIPCGRIPITCRTCTPTRPR